MWLAYTTCQTATLVYTVNGVDMSDTHTITVQSKSGGCAVSDVVQGFTIVADASVETYTCSRLAKNADGGLLVIGCGASGDLKLRPRPLEQVGHVCGRVYQYSGGVIDILTGTPVSQVEECFWQAYQTCTPATLLYTVAYRLYFTRTFTVTSNGSACKINDYPRQAGTTPNTSILTTIACAGLAQRDGGLLISRCGSDGTIFVPPGKAAA